MRSKENNVLEPFFNSSKHWHFDELHKTVKISKPQLSFWLRRFEKEGLIKRIKPRGKMPYYLQNVDNPSFRNKKKLFALQEFEESGLLNHLLTLEGAKVVILFGSFTRYDWYKNSDIDVFILGDDSQFEQGKYELKLDREIQIHNARNNKELKKMGHMLPYIVSGNFIKGSIQDLGVEIHSKV